MSEHTRPTLGKLLQQYLAPAPTEQGHVTNTYHGGAVEIVLMRDQLGERVHVHVDGVTVFAMYAASRIEIRDFGLDRHLVEDILILPPAGGSNPDT